MYDIFLTGIDLDGLKSELLTPSVSSFHINSRTQKVNVKVSSQELCPRFSGICIENIKIDNSPKWLQDRLKAIGLTPINNIVDITNYVLHEVGQPLHAYDLKKIKSNPLAEVPKILVKTLFKTFPLVTSLSDFVELRFFQKTPLSLCI